MNRSIYHVQRDSVERIADMLNRSSLSLGDRVCVADAESGETVYELTAYPSTLLSNWRIVAGRGFTPSLPGAPLPAGVTSFKSRTGAVAPMAGDYAANQVSVTPSGGLAATDVQAALVELDGEATALTAKVTTVEGKADGLRAKVTTLEGQVAEAQAKTGVTSFKSRTGTVTPQTGDYAANQVSVTPSGGLAATDVQAALVELDGEATALTAKVTAVEGKADGLRAKVTTLEGQVAEAQAKTGVTSFKSRTGAVAPMAGDYAASQVSVTPSGGLAATDVQAALVELDGEATALTAKVTTVEGKADGLRAKVTTLEGQVAEAQAKTGVTSFKSRTGAVAPMAGDYAASQVSVTPSGGLAATDVQAALVELDGEATALTAKVTTVEGKADGLRAKVTTLEGQVAEAQAKTGVTSFKSRTGTVTPQTGDYAANQVSVTPAGDLKATDVQAALVEINRKGGSADQINVRPSGTLVATNVQAALTELDQKKLGISVATLPESAANEGDWVTFFNPYINAATKTTVGKLFASRRLINPLLTGYRETVESQTVTTAAHTLGDISLGNVKYLMLTVDTTVTLPGLSLPTDTGAALSVIVVQDGTGNHSVTFTAPSGQSIVWDCDVKQPTIATGPGEETMFSFYFISGSAAWKGVRTHKGG